MASEQDAGRAQKLTWTSIVVVIGGVLVGGYALITWLYKAPEQTSQVNLDRVSGAAPGKINETPAYREQLNESNRQGAAQAQASNASFVASLKLESEPYVPPKAQKPPTDTDAGKAAQQGEQGSNNGGNGNNNGNSDQNSRRQQALDKFLAKLNPDVKEQHITGLQTARVLGSEGSGTGQGGAGGADGSYQQWSQSLGGGMRTVSSTNGGINGAGTNASQVPIEVIPPYWRAPGYIDLGIDSDNSTTPVLGRIDTGKYAGIVLKASDGAKLTGEGVVIHFSEMAYKGINYKVDAYALQEDSLLANVATDVNHRYMSRIVLPALLGGIGGIGEMYSQANTQLVSNGFNSQVVRPGLPDGAAVLGAMAGGAAGQAAKVLTEDAQRVPATQVTVTKGQVVAIQFMRGVYSGDAIAPGQGGDEVKAAVPIRSTSQAALQPTLQPASDDQWRAAARQQIQAQQLRQEFNR
ncbi:conjugal transfer protein TraO [Pseudomonas sp. W2-17]|uniref:conjugal transfer protein TraO n=1 Tax=Pseudomonas sp. W2-17 TaxID=3058039 RepID=UPI0034E0D2C2